MAYPLAIETVERFRTLELESAHERPDSRASPAQIDMLLDFPSRRLTLTPKEREGYACRVRFCPHPNAAPSGSISGACARRAG
jgi:hypothetical protein